MKEREERFKMLVNVEENLSKSWKINFKICKEGSITKDCFREFCYNNNYKDLVLS